MFSVSKAGGRFFFVSLFFLLLFSFLLRAYEFKSMMTMGVASSLATALASYVVVFLRSIGIFLTSALNVVEELVRSLFVGWVHTVNRISYGILGQLVRGEEGERHHRLGGRSSIKRKTSHSDVFGFSTLNFLHTVDGAEGHSVEGGEGGEGGEAMERRTSTRGPHPPQRSILASTNRKRLRDFDTLVENSRGLIEDVHFAIEAVISVAFEFLRDLVRTVFRLRTRTEKEERARRRERKHLRRRLKKWQTFYTFDASDAIVKSGYPLQEFDVVTRDGYHVQLQRIPNKGKKAVVFMHGVLDTSLTWVSQSISSTRGSVAFAAYEAGFDIWLCNTRANFPQRNDRLKKSQFWKFSANELALEDVKAQIDFVRRKKASEGDEDTAIEAVGHSLGGACLLMYAVHQGLVSEDHHLDRLVLLSPAGFHSKIPLSLLWAKYVFPLASRALDIVAPSRGIGLGLRTPLLRFLIFKLLADIENHSILRELVSVALKAAFGGDTSAWTKIMTFPHYNKRSMPLISLHVASHFAQWSRTGTFSFFDGGKRWNMKTYGSPAPPSVAQHYDLLRNLPVDVVGGTNDGLIPADMSYMHYVSLLNAGAANVTYKEVDFGHLDFIMGGEGSADLSRYILDCISRHSYPSQTDSAK